MTKITNIKPAPAKPGKSNCLGHGEQLGILIELDNGKSITISIDDTANCCENYGFLESQDDYEDFIEAEFMHASIVNGNYTATELIKHDISEDNAIFVNVVTSKGTLQFAVYNEHNGYYGHNVTIKFLDEDKSTFL